MNNNHCFYHAGFRMKNVNNCFYHAGFRMKNDTMEESASEEEQLESDCLEIEVGDCFVALDDEHCVNECADVDDVLQNVIISLWAMTIQKVSIYDIQCQLMTNTEVCKKFLTFASIYCQTWLL